MLEEAEIYPGPEFRIALVRAAAQMDSDCAVFADRMLPDSLNTEAFDMRNPKLSSANLSDLQIAFEFVDGVVTRRLIPSLKQGQAGSVEVLSLARVLADELPNKDVGSSMIVKAARDDALDIALYLLALGGDPPRPSTSTAVSLVRSAKQGSKALVKMAVAQNKFWQGADVELRSAEQSLMTLGPAVAEATKEMEGAESRMSADYCRALCRKMPLWFDGLWPTQLEAFMRVLQEQLKAWRLRLQECLASKDGLEHEVKLESFRFVDTMRYAAEMLKTYEAESAFFTDLGDSIDIRVKEAQQADLEHSAASIIDFYLQLEPRS